MTPPATGWWRRPWVLGVGAIAVVAAIVVGVVLVAAGGAPSSPDADGAWSTGDAHDHDRVADYFPDVSQSEFEEALHETCDRFRALVGDTALTVEDFAEYADSVERDTIIRKGWTPSTGNSRYDAALRSNMQADISVGTFQGDDGPCAEYEEIWSEAIDLMNAMRE